ncbi:universal stress protein [Streptomyces neyagawaensis]
MWTERDGNAESCSTAVREEGGTVTIPLVVGIAGSKADLGGGRSGRRRGRPARPCGSRSVGASEADLLVVGGRGRQGHLGLRLGLINHAVPHHVPCPVAVVPRL